MTRWMQVWPVALFAVAACSEEPHPARAVAAPPTALPAASATGPADAPVAAPSASVASPASSAEAAAEPSGPCPPEMALVGRACVDRWEAHLVVRAADGSARPHPHNERPPDDARFEARSAAGVWPQAYISREEAAAACRHAGKRLCSWLEWRRACQGRRWLRYPYGWRERDGVCNTSKPHLLARVYGPDNRKWTYDAFNDPSLDATPGFLAKTGAHPGCESEGGLADMVGNLHEWVSTPVTPATMGRIEADDVPRVEQYWAHGHGMFLGGFFSTNGEHGPGCLYATVAHGPTYHDYSTGFRCCADPRRDRDP